MNIGGSANSGIPVPNSQFDSSDASTKLALSYLEELKVGTQNLRSFDSHIRAASRYQELLSISHKAKRQALNSNDAQSVKLGYDIEEAEVELEFVYAGLFDRFNILDEYAREQIKRVAQVGDRLVVLIGQYRDQLGMVWPGGCLSLGNIHRFLGNPDHQAASYRLGYEAVKHSENPAAFYEAEVSILRALDSMHLCPQTAPSMAIGDLRPFPKVYVDDALKAKAVPWLVWGGILSLCYGIGLIGVAVGIYQIYVATTRGIESFGALKSKRIR